jgi:hypothetical protein
VLFVIYFFVIFVFDNSFVPFFELVIDALKLFEILYFWIRNHNLNLPADYDVEFFAHTAIFENDVIRVKDFIP